MDKRVQNKRLKAWVEKTLREAGENSRPSRRERDPDADGIIRETTRGHIRADSPDINSYAHSGRDDDRENAETLDKMFN